jgi:hypothetical protein
VQMVSAVMTVMSASRGACDECPEGEGCVSHCGGLVVKSCLVGERGKRWFSWSY